MQVGELEGEVRRLAQAQVEALGRAEAAESHVMEVLQRQEEARAQMDGERQGFVDSMVSGRPSEGSSAALQEHSVRWLGGCVVRRSSA